MKNRKSYFAAGEYVRKWDRTCVNPMGEAQTATRPVGSCAGRRSERVIHTSAKVSLHAVSNAEINRKIMKKRCQIEPKSLPNRSLVRPGGLQGPEGHPKASKSTQKGPQECSRAPLGRPRDTPRAAKRAQRALKGSPRATQRGLGRGQIQ